VKELSQSYDINDIGAAALYIAYGERKESPVEEHKENAGTVRLF